MVSRILKVLASITVTAPPSSEDTQTSLPSCVNAAQRGRGGISTLARFFPLSKEKNCAMLVVSVVLTISCPSGLTAMPSGSTPVGICTSIFLVSMFHTVISALFSLET